MPLAYRFKYSDLFLLPTLYKTRLGIWYSDQVVPAYAYVFDKSYSLARNIRDSISATTIIR